MKDGSNILLSIHALLCITLIDNFVYKSSYNAIERREGCKGGKETNKKSASSNAYYKIASAANKIATTTMSVPKRVEVSTPQAVTKSECLFLTVNPLPN